MQKKSGQTSNLYLQISLFLNFIIIAGIIVYILKRKNLSPMSTPFASAKTSRVLKYQNILMPTIENFNDSKAQLKEKNYCSNQIITKSAQTKTIFKQTLQNDDKSKQIEDSIAILKDQLYFERQRNDLLEAEQEELKTQLKRLQQQIRKQQSPQYTNLKNELQFCQNKLRQSSQIEIELRKKIEDYERISISMLDHPEYERLRQLNNQYKDTIRNLQAKLLQRNGNKNEYLQLSFNYL